MDVAHGPGVADLAAWWPRRGRVVALTGAGISTPSGIPDYRDADGQWKRSAPMTHQQFTGSAHLRRRYWARSMAGWPHFSGVQPNAAHLALAALEQQGSLAGIITQNVDRLHERAGSRSVIDLHGRLDVVACLGCGERHRRDWLQERLLALNPGWRDYSDAIAPDGDADVDGVDFDTFRVPPCQRCGGVLMPDVVFYGGTIPPVRRGEADALLESASALLVVGSSLMIGSAWRLVRAALDRGMSIAAVNQGRTRADDLLDLKITRDASRILPGLPGAGART